MPEFIKDAAEAWRHYVSTGAIAQQHLRLRTYRAWERSHGLNANPRRAKAECLSPEATARLLETERELRQAARPYMASLSRAAGQERHAAMLSDRQGVVLDVMGDEESIYGPESVPGPGALCSEAVCGANGLGTPLAEGDYAELVATEHFIEGFHFFTCQGIPLRDEGRIVGVISTSVRRPAASERLRDIMVCAARGVEAELLRRRMENRIARTLAADLGDPLPLEDLRQDIVQAHAAAQLKLEIAARFFAGNRLADALRLLEIAQSLVCRFEERARLWTELASDELGQPGPVQLVEMVARMVDLLDTEAATREVELRTVCQERVVVRADVRALGRTLLHELLSAMQVAGQGGAVVVEVKECSRGMEGEVTLVPHPAYDGAPFSAGRVMRSLRYPRVLRD